MREGLLESLSHQSILVHSSETKKQLEEDSQKLFLKFL